ncbi:MAG: hypothetical protein HYS34_07750 [Acidobacteria bacterium]|nr:hypothetical protein [Acidobacteriota bacterium]
MSQEAPGIVVVDRRIDPVELGRLVALYFGDMVKIVIDVRRRVAAVGGELHAIRPSLGNRSMEIQDADTRGAVREITLALIGRGEELPQ